MLHAMTPKRIFQSGLNNQYGMWALTALMLEGGGAPRIVGL